MKSIKRNQSGRRGGVRPGAGRPKGATTKKTREIAEAALKGGVSPLEYMLKVMRAAVPANADALTLVRARELRFEAAKAAAPYIHPRLNAVEHTGKGGGPVRASIEVVFVGANKG